MNRCRACKTPKTKGDPCPGADCPRRNGSSRLRAVSPPITATAKHGFHAPVTRTALLTGLYDQPIRATRWQSAGR